MFEKLARGCLEDTAWICDGKIMDILPVESLFVIGLNRKEIL